MEILQNVVRRARWITTTETEFYKNQTIAPGIKFHTGKDPICVQCRKALLGTTMSGISEPAHSELAIPVVFAPNRERKLRCCVDYRSLNLETVANNYRLPRFNDQIDSLGGTTVLTTLVPMFG